MRREAVSSSAVSIGLNYSWSKELDGPYHATVSQSPYGRCARASLMSKMASSVNDWEELPVELSMSYSQSPPVAENEWLRGKGISSERSARNRDDRADLRSGRRPLKAPIHPPQPSNVKDGEVASDRPSIARRIL